MEGERAEDQIPGSRSPGSDITLVKADFRDVTVAVARHGKGRHIGVNGVHGDGDAALAAPMDEFRGQVPLAGGQIEHPENRAVHVPVR